MRWRRNESGSRGVQEVEDGLACFRDPLTFFWGAVKEGNQPTGITSFVLILMFLIFHYIYIYIYWGGGQI